MSLFNNNPADPPGKPGDSQAHVDGVSQPGATEPAAPPLAGDPIAYAAVHPTTTAYPSRPPLPEDLRITWSWPHLFTFLAFGFGSLITVQIAALVLLSANRHL